jgi:AraC family transcriptional regulator
MSTQKLTIFYFSGTGNSKNATQWLLASASKYNIESSIHNIATIDRSSTWEQLINFIMHHKLLGWNPEFYSIYYDDPDPLDRAKCTSDICFATKKDIKDQSIFKSNIIKGGKYAVFRYKGPYERLWELYYIIYGDWLLSADYKLRDVPPLEKYINHSPKTKPEDLLTEIYIPIE